jgi:hypothetical protein
MVATNCYVEEYEMSYLETLNTFLLSVPGAEIV